MDHLFRHANPIVPLAKVEKIDATFREREFARNYDGADAAKQEAITHSDDKEDYGRVQHIA